MQKYTRVGIDLGKNYFQIHALAADGGVAVNRKLKRSKFLEFFERIEGCEIGMEACGSAHYWARELQRLEHKVSLMPPTYTKPYVKRGKNDAVDAAACCEAMTRPDMRFVPIKSAEQQATLSMHKTRELLTKQRTMSINALRGQLAEFGLVSPKGTGHVRELITQAQDDVTLPEAIKQVVRIMARQIEALAEEIRQLEKSITHAAKQNELCALLDKIPGIGPVIASAIVATLPDARQFETGRDFAAWLGLTPRQYSTGGKPKLGSITKKGNRYLRKLLVLAATSLSYRVGDYTGTLAEWAQQLRARKSARLTTVAFANKLARIIWAMLNTGECFRQESFLRVKPAQAIAA
jgi:transposase